MACPLKAYSREPGSLCGLPGQWGLYDGGRADGDLVMWTVVGRDQDYMASSLSLLTLD